MDRRRLPRPAGRQEASMPHRSKREGRHPWWDVRPSSSRLLPRPLCRLVELREVAAEEVARALLHLPDALAREAPLLAQVLQRARIVLRQAVAQNVPGQLAHPLAHAPEGVAHVLLPLGADDLLVRGRAVVAQAVE